MKTKIVKLKVRKLGTLSDTQMQTIKGGNPDTQLTPGVQDISEIPTCNHKKHKVKNPAERPNIN